MDRLTLAYSLIAAMVVVGSFVLFFVRRGGRDQTIRRERAARARERKAKDVADQ